MRHWILIVQYLQACGKFVQNELREQFDYRHQMEPPCLEIVWHRSCRVQHSMANHRWWRQWKSPTNQFSSSSSEQHFKKAHFWELNIWLRNSYHINTRVLTEVFRTILSWIYLSACNTCDGCRLPPSSCLGDTLWPLCRTPVTSSPGGYRAQLCASTVWRHPGSVGTLHPGVQVNRGRRRLPIRITCFDKDHTN